MNAGLPGAGIGGVFYLIAALFMPFWSVFRLLTGRAPERSGWRVVARQFLLATAIIAAISVTGWLLGLWLITSETSATGAAAKPGGPAPQMIARAMVFVTLSTLAILLAAVEVLRIALSRRRPFSRMRAGTGRLSVLLFASALALAAGHAEAQTPSGGAVQTPALDAALTRADDAFAKADAERASREYEAVLSLDPAQPRALFRLGQLRRSSNPESAVQLFRRYVAAQPRDAWGHLALADAYARTGRAAPALAAYEEALALDPQEAEVILARPRLLRRLGHIDESIAAYTSWLAAHPDDADAWRELGDAYQRAGRFGGAVRALERARAMSAADPALDPRIASLRRRTAPAVTASLLAVGETDVSALGGAVAGDVHVGDGSRLGVSYRRRRVQSFGEAGYSQRLTALVGSRLRAGVQVDGSAGAVWLDRSGSPLVRPEVTFRLRRTPFARGVSLDVRGQHGPLDLTPDLVAVPLLSSQAAVTLDVPVASRWRARGLTRATRLTREDEQNVRTIVGGGPAVRLTDGVHVGGTWQQIRNSLPGARGYFSPRRAEVADIGLEIERELGTVSLSLDAAAGLQRVEKVISPMAPWAPAFRAWMFLAWSLQPGQQLLLEMEAYDSQVANVVATAERWRQVAATVSVRVTLPR